MKHKHHIIPRHLKSPCPLADITIDLTVEEHAEAHRINYETYGRWEDWCAWQGLSKMIGREEIIKESIRQGQKESVRKQLENGTHNFYGGSIQKETQDRLVENGTHWSFNSERVSEVRKEMMDKGTHNFVSQHPQKKKFRCLETNKVSTQAAFTRMARNKGLDKWPHELVLEINK